MSTIKHLLATVYHDRNYTGKLSWFSKARPPEFNLSAKGSSSSRALEPQKGEYRLERIVRVPEEDPEARAAFGPAVIVFIESRHKTGWEQDKLVLHGGDTDVSGELLPTEGSLRVSNEDLEAILDYVGSEKTVGLTIKEEKLGVLKRTLSPPPKVSRSEPPRISRRSVGTSSSRTDVPYDDTMDSLFYWLWFSDMMSGPEGIEERIQEVPPIDLPSVESFEPRSEAAGAVEIGSGVERSELEASGSGVERSSWNTDVISGNLPPAPPVINSPFPDEPAPQAAHEAVPAEVDKGADFSPLETAPAESSSADSSPSGAPAY